tara:strand:+ start:57558 stop:57866 length:309 start_codon:yes stop_codon:yes gene_type:complete
MGLKQIIWTATAVGAGIAVLYNKLDRDQRRHEARFKKLLDEGLFKTGRHNAEELKRKNPEAVAFDEAGKPMSLRDVVKEVMKRSVEDPAKRIRESQKQPGDD